MENLAQPDTRKSFFSFALVILFLLVGYLIISHPVKTLNLENIKYVNIAGQSVRVDLATTVAEQMQGLSGRVTLSLDQGMLFIFPKPDTYLFWMKDMNFPIDMIWLGENMKVVYIKKNALPESYPATFGPSANAKYVLEVVSGFADKNNLKIGDSVVFTY